MGNIQVAPGTRLNIATCPSDFEASINNTCRYKCPTQYKYGQGASGELDRCIHESNNAYSVPLQKIPVSSAASAFEAERKRFGDELRAVQAKVQADLETQKKLSKEDEMYKANIDEYNTIRSQYAGFNSIKDSAAAIKGVSDSLKPLRSPTQPYSDIEKERRSILQIVSEKMIVVQVALLTVLICAAEYLVLPAEYAHKLAFLTLSVGLGVGIFLTRK